MSFLENILVLALLSGGEEPLKRKCTDQPIWLENLSKSISYPTFIETAREKEIVLVSFKLEACGSLSVLEMNYSNSEFRDFVLKELESIDLSPILPDNEIYHLRLSFVKE